MLEQVVTTEAFKVVFHEALTTLKKKSTTFFNSNKLNVDNAYNKAYNVERVKTIWQVDKSVNLNEFYHPSKIIIAQESVELKSINIFPENAKVVIQGTAGQGKSILLRYLSGQRLREGGTIPLFIELRKITSRVDIKSLILSSLSELGIQLNETELTFVFESGKFTLLLDAFDEVPESLVQDTITYLESICAQHYNQQIIITSRPGAEVQKISYFSVYKLDTLQVSDFRPMLMKFFSDDKEIVDEILKSLHENSSDIIGLISTPLLLTLLAITYKSYSKIPSQLHEFYEDIFHVLVNRHDATKPGFKREYKSGLNERQLEKLFCAFCFYSSISGNASLSRKDAMQVLSKAKHILKFELTSDFSFISDCVKNTCLILDEGFSYHFIHKSIMEYHCAKFISESPLLLKERFYAFALKSANRYDVELSFLKIIDTYYYNKLFFIPLCESFFDNIGFKNGEFKKLTHETLLKNSIANYEQGELTVFSLGEILSSEHNYFDSLYSEIVNDVLVIFHEEKTDGEIIPSASFSISQLIIKHNKGEHFNEIINKALLNATERYKLIIDDMNEKDELISMVDFGFN